MLNQFAIMKEILINGRTGESRVIIGETLDNVGKYMPSSNVFIITDMNVKEFHGASFPKFPIYCIEPGENSKNLETAGEIYHWLLDMGADRSSFILGIGGGVVCDLAGFVASTYMRGVGFGFVATSLLAQVDASVGGKNGVNLDGYKNIIGTFNQPKFVVCDIQLLKTLPKEEFANGFAEIVKHTLIADAQMFNFLEENIESVKTYDTDVLCKLVEHSVKIKAGIVQADEQEKGERKKLNLGHTWGHAVEKVTGLSHGKSVSIGLEFAARFSVSKSYLINRDYMRLMNLLRDLELPICIKVSTSKIFDALIKDKKKTSKSIDYIFMKGIGEVEIEQISFEEIRSFIEHP
jgi:3-dehydroquinate synthase